MGYGPWGREGSGDLTRAFKHKISLTENNPTKHTEDVESPPGGEGETWMSQGSKSLEAREMKTQFQPRSKSPKFRGQKDTTKGGVAGHEAVHGIR